MPVKTDLFSKSSDVQEELFRIFQNPVTLDLTRGKPSAEQLSLADPMLAFPACGAEAITDDGIDTRNYGSPEGVPALRALFAELLGVCPENILLGGNSTLSLLCDAIDRAMLFGAEAGCAPWRDQPVRFLCPVPGYDRHFALCERFGIEMIPIPLTGHGPDMDRVESLACRDETIKGILCIPKYSNPTGETYSPDVVRRLAAMKPAARDFRIFWDMAYLLHDLSDPPDELENLFALTRGTDAENRVLGFFSTSKITYAGAGIAVLVGSEMNIRAAARDLSLCRICPDKLNEWRHLHYLQSAAHVRELVAAQAALLRPKLRTAEEILGEALEGEEGFSLTHPRGGYFLTLRTPPHCAARTVTLCARAGVKLTPAGAAFPYHNDPEDSVLRIAPSFPPLPELREALRIVALCAKGAASGISF